MGQRFCDDVNEAQGISRANTYRMSTIVRADNALKNSWGGSMVNALEIRSVWIYSKRTRQSLGCGLVVKLLKRKCTHW